MDLWILVVLLVIVQPIFGWWRFRRFVARGEMPTTNRKLRLYFVVLLTQWTLTAMCAWVMARRHLDIAELGLLRAGPAWAWILVAVLGLVLFGATLMAVRAIRAGQSEIPSHLRHIARILPQNSMERLGFTPVALTAGICEETLYRGFLVFAFYQASHNVWLALGLSTVAFGFGHLYQGPRGIFSTMVLGMVLATLYSATKSLWPGIALHAFIDLANGNALGTLSKPRPASPLSLTPPTDHTHVEVGEIPSPERTTGT